MKKNKNSHDLSHPQTFVMVRVRCDVGIAPLVEALNSIDGVLTLDSCQEWHNGQAHIFFTYGHEWESNWKNVAVLVQTISEELDKQGNPCDFKIRMEWSNGSIDPRAVILIEPKHADAIATYLKKVSARINRRMIRLVGDRSGIGPRN